MINMVDSSAWLEYFANSKNAKYYASAIENTKLLIVSPINIYEVYKKILIERDEQSALQAIGIMQEAKVIEINSTLVIDAAKFSYKYKLPMADSLIYTTAKFNNAILWTQDVDFKDLENVKYFKKI